MTPRTETIISLLLLLVALFALTMLYLVNSVAEDPNWEFALRALLYPAVLGLIVISWKKIDRRINNDSPKNVDEL